MCSMPAFDWGSTVSTIFFTFSLQILGPLLGGEGAVKLYQVAVGVAEVGHADAPIGPILRVVDEADALLLNLIHGGVQVVHSDDEGHAVLRRGARRQAGRAHRLGHDIAPEEGQGYLAAHVEVGIALTLS